MGREAPAAERVLYFFFSVLVLSLLLEGVVDGLAVAVGDGHVQVLVLLAELHCPDIVVGKKKLTAFACKLYLRLGHCGVSVIS